MYKPQFTEEQIKYLCGQDDDAIETKDISIIVWHDFEKEQPQFSERQEKQSYGASMSVLAVTMDMGKPYVMTLTWEKVSVRKKWVYRFTWHDRIYNGQVYKWAYMPEVDSLA